MSGWFCGVGKLAWTPARAAQMSLGHFCCSIYQPKRFTVQGPLKTMSTLLPSRYTMYTIYRNETSSKQNLCNIPKNLRIIFIFFFSAKILNPWHDPIGSWHPRPNGFRSPWCLLISCTASHRRGYPNLALREGICLVVLIQPHERKIWRSNCSIISPSSRGGSRGENNKSLKLNHHLGIWTTILLTKSPAWIQGLIISQLGGERTGRVASYISIKELREGFF